MTVLDEIQAHKVEEVEAREAARSLDDLRRLCEPNARAGIFARTLREGAARDGVALIAEVKRRSPSAGELRGDADATVLGTTYVKSGASAVSVLTDEKF